MSAGEGASGREAFPGWGPRAAMREPLALAAVAGLAILLGARHTPKTPYLLEAGWTATVYFALPLSFVVAREARAGAARLVAWTGAIALVVACLARPFADPVREAVKGAPGLVIWALAASTAVSLAAARSAGVDLRRWGLGLGDLRWWAPRTLALAAAALGFVALAAVADPSLREFYPDYEPAREDKGVLWAYVASFGLYFVGWEFAFRGFLLFGFARVAGPLVAVLLQAFPFFLMHRNGPESEMVASFVGGAALAAFCYRARSFWPAVALHWVLNAGMNVIGFFW